MSTMFIYTDLMIRWCGLHILVLQSSSLRFREPWGGIRKDQNATGGVQLCVFKDNSIETIAHVFAECISLEKPANYCMNDVWWRFNKFEVLGITHQLVVEIIVENDNYYWHPNEKKKT